MTATNEKMQLAISVGGGPAEKSLTRRGRGTICQGKIRPPFPPPSTSPHFDQLPWSLVKKISSAKGKGTERVSRKTASDAMSMKQARTSSIHAATKWPRKKKIDDGDLSWEMKITDTGGGGGGGRSHTLPIFKEYDRRRPKQAECNEERDIKNVQGWCIAYPSSNSASCFPISSFNCSASPAVVYGGKGRKLKKEEEEARGHSPASPP